MEGHQAVVRRRRTKSLLVCIIHLQAGRSFDMKALEALGRLRQPFLEMFDALATELQKATAGAAA